MIYFFRFQDFLLFSFIHYLQLFVLVEMCNEEVLNAQKIKMCAYNGNSRYIFFYSRLKKLNLI